MAKSKRLIVGIDIGSSCGYAVLDGKKRVSSGTWKLWTDKDRRHGADEWVRWIRMRDCLVTLNKRLDEEFGEDYERIFVYEDVRSHGKGGVRAGHVYGGFKAALQMTVALLGYPCDSLPVQTWKKAAVGKGNATKTEYVKSMNRRFRLRMTVKKREDEAAALGVAEAYRLANEQEV